IYLNKRPLAMLEYDDIYYYHNSHIGTPEILTDSQQFVVWQADYDLWGSAEILVSDVENNLRFTGQYFDSETSLHYNWNRYYDPMLGRYITSDPIGLAGGINTYLYVSNSTLSFVDPTGQFAVNAVNAIGGAIFGASAAFWYSIVTTACHSNLWTTADWPVVIENTLFGAAAGAITGAGFGTLLLENSAGALVFGSTTGMLGGLVGNFLMGVKERGSNCGCSF
ncbi:RHS repeat-associated core domain-containing protein, partial [Pleionea sp. CnH1-48]|uniref:RHS repeat-associated core domain-containing protein n=1 Tax=Pleionea sp. CnH1-48 TaxID=2954494 RepID=UPI00273A7441